MKKTLSLVLFLLIATATTLCAQILNIPLNGKVTVRNSRVNTGKVQPVADTQIEADYATPQKSDSNGDFSLMFSAAKKGQSATLTATPPSQWKLVNETMLRGVVIGMEDTLQIWVAKPENLDREKADMIGINIKKLTEEKDRKIADINRQKKQLNQQYTDLEAQLALEQKGKNDYIAKTQKQLQDLDIRIQALNDSLSNIHHSFETRSKLVEQYADELVKENLDLRDNTYILAYQAFMRGQLDSVQLLLPLADIEKELKESEQELRTAQKMEEAAKKLRQSGKRKKENGIKKLQLKADTYALQNDYDRAIATYLKLTQYDIPNEDKAAAYFNAGDLYKTIGNFTGADTCFTHLNALLEKLHQTNPNDVAHKHNLGLSYERLGDLHQAQGNYDKALLFFEKDLQLSEELYAANPKSEQLKKGLAISYSKLGSLHQAQGNYDKALLFFEKDLQLSEELYAANPKSEQLKKGLAISYERLGSLHKAQGNYDKALLFFEKYLQLFPFC